MINMRNGLLNEAEALPYELPEKFFGREDALSKLRVTLQAGVGVLVYGISGIGKSTLATLIARRYLQSSDQAIVVWLDAGTDDLDTLCEHTALYFGDDAVARLPDLDAKCAEVRSLLEQSRPLVVLDGIASEEAARGFVRQCATGLPLIITSDEAVSGPWTPVELGPMTETAAMALYVTNAGSDVALEKDDIRALCRTLNYHPLALEIAGQQARIANILPGEWIAAMPPQVPPNANPVHILMSVLSKRLPRDVQGVFLLLGATFAGSGTVEFLASVSQMPPDIIRRIMVSLDKMRLARIKQTPGGEVLQLHPVVYAFARTWLRGMGRLGPAEDQALKACIDYAEHYAAPPTRDDAKLMAEFDNLLGAAAWAYEEGNFAAVSELVMNLVGKGGFLIERGYISEAAQLLRWGTAAAQSLGITQVEALFTNKLSTILPPAPEQEQAGTPEIWDREEEEADEIQQDRSPTDDALETIGAQQGAPTIETPIPTLPEQESSPDEGQPLKPPPLNMEALEKLRQQEQAGSEEPEVEEEEAAPDEGQPLKPPPLNMDALEKLRQQEQGAPSTTETPPPAPPETLPEQESESDEGQPLKPPPLNMDALKEMQAASEAGTRTMPDEGVSEKSLLYAIEQAQESGDKDVEFGLYIQMGDMYMDKRHPADAVPVYEKALQLAAQDPENELAALHKLAAAELESGSPEDAAQHAQQGLIIARRIGDAGREADLLMEMGDSLLAQGTADAAAEYYGQASVRYQDVGIGQGEAWALVNQGDVYCDADRFTDAMTTFERALEIFRSLGDSEGEEQALLQMGHCRFAFGHTEDAIGAFFHAVRSARDRGDLSVAAFYLKDLSHLQDRAREIPAAIVTMRQALSLAYQGGDDALLTDILLMLGRMLMDDISDIGIAINVLEEVQNDPTGEAERLYKRCEARMERLSRAGYSIVRSPGPSIREYADAAWEM